MYCDRQGLEGLRHWVATQKVYCDLRGLASWGCLAIQRVCALRHGQPGHDTTIQGVRDMATTQPPMPATWRRVRLGWAKVRCTVHLTQF